MIYGLILIPLMGALAAWLVPDNRQRPLLLPLVATLHTAMVLDLLADTPPPVMGGWLYLDRLGALILLSCSVLFLVCAVYSVGYLGYRQERSNRVLCMGLLVCLSAMGMVTMTQHLGLLWVALETTTVSMAPLIYFNHNARSIEATWKYLLLCSVGIGLALLGLLFLAYSTYVAQREATLLLGPLMAWRLAYFHGECTPAQQQAVKTRLHRAPAVLRARLWELVGGALFKFGNERCDRLAELARDQGRVGVHIVHALQHVAHQPDPGGLKIVEGPGDAAPCADPGFCGGVILLVAQDHRRDPLPQADRGAGELRDGAKIVVGELDEGAAAGIIHRRLRLEGSQHDGQIQALHQGGEGSAGGIGDHVHEQQVEVRLADAGQGCISAF